MDSNSLQDRLQSLAAAVDDTLSQLNIESVEKEIAEITLHQQNPDFWNDNIRAQKVMQRLGSLTQKAQPWRALESQIKENLELLALNDDTLASEIAKSVDGIAKEYELLKKQILYNQPYDDYDAIITIYAGAGGTDAQDWTQMLLRMYVRWAEQNNFKTEIIQESSGEEAGIKSATISCSGPLAYGKLKGENGVHRLVRLSPFNADNLRQTSFAKVEVLPRIDTPSEVTIEDKDIKLDVYRAGGHGGQSVNTTDSAVRVTHLPTGISVAIQNERSQLQNKETALTILRSKLAQLQLEQHAKTLNDIKGPNEQAAWGNQIRNYVMHPYTLVKDARTKVETTDAQSILDGNINDFITAFADYSINR